MSRPSPLQNRVLPTGEIVAIPARGTFTGNRGILHREDKSLGTARWTKKAWICCTLDWQGRRRDVMGGRSWTELFFLDEAVALAAGHRPCAYCRRPAYRAFCDAWQVAHGARQKAPFMDRVLHAERLIGKAKRRHKARLDTLPDGTIIWRGDQPLLIWDHRMFPYTPEGYAKPVPRPHRIEVEVLTPPALQGCLSEGYRPVLHPSAEV